MTKLDFPQLLFGRGAGGQPSDPDADLVLDEWSPKTTSKGKNKRNFDPLERFIGLDECLAQRPAQRPGAVRKLLKRFGANDDTVVPDNEEGFMMDPMMDSTFPTMDPTFLAMTTPLVDSTEMEESLLEQVEPQYEPLDVPQEAESSKRNEQPEEDDWEVPAWEDSDEELDI